MGTAERLGTIDAEEAGTFLVFVRISDNGKPYCTPECGLYHRTVQHFAAAARPRALLVSAEHFAISHDTPPDGIIL